LRETKYSFDAKEGIAASLSELQETGHDTSDYFGFRQERELAYSADLSDASIIHTVIYLRRFCESIR
jgi:hypothetical protein